MILSASQLEARRQAEAALGDFLIRSRATLFPVGHPEQKPKFWSTLVEPEPRKPIDLPQPPEEDEDATPLPPPLLYWNTEQTYTANCPDGTTGDSVTETTPANTYSSVISQADADAQALAAATALATSELVCVSAELVLLASWTGGGGDTGTVTVSGVPNARIAQAAYYGNGDGDTADERMIVTVQADAVPISFGGITAIDFAPSPELDQTADASQYVTTGHIDFVLNNSHGADGTFFVDVYGYLT